jgi:alkylhydroperoxidase/carboxymuconolactone decarboxylase family protein YurZ
MQWQSKSCRSHLSHVEAPVRHRQGEGEARVQVGARIREEFSVATDLVKTPSAYLSEASPEAGVAFRNLRNAVMKSGPLDATTCELVLIGSFALLGYERSFKIHGLRLLKQGVAPEALRQVALVLLAATASMFTVTEAMRWVDEITAEHAAGS